MTDVFGKKRKFTILAAIAVAAVMIWGLWPSRPTGLGTDITSHISTPASLYLSLNGREIVNGSIRGRAEGGGATYASRWGDALNWDLAWYDILADRSYRLKFAVAASELATLDTEKSNATISIVVGPGADIVVTAAHPEVARLIALRKGKELAELQGADPVILRELCAEPLPDDDPFTQEKRKYVESFKHVSSTGGYHLEQALAARETYLQNNKISPRCPDAGEE